MKKILLALLLLTTPAFAVAVEGGDPYGGISGSLTTAGDTVSLNLNGLRWASVKFSVITTGNAGVTLQYSTDNGSNFYPAPMARRLNLVNANPTVATITNNTTLGADSWEVVVPSSLTQFQAKCAGSGTAVLVALAGYMPLVPGAPITGVLFDTTSAVNTAIDTGTLDFSGWEYTNVSYNTPAAGSGTISMVDDAGTSVAMFTVPASAIAWYPFAVASPSVSQVTALPATGSTGALPIQKRMRFQSIGVAAVTSRIRIEVRR